MKKNLALTLTTAALALLALAGCSSMSTPASSAGGGSSSDSASSSGGGSSTADLSTASTSLGTIVVDGKGMSVYDYKPDVKDSGKSACTGGCATLWPPVVATSSKPAVDGVTGTVGTITRDDGTMQVTVNGLPIYTYAQDAKAGDVNGQGVGNIWYVVSPAGDAITSAAGASTGTSGGYGY